MKNNKYLKSFLTIILSILLLTGSALAFSFRNMTLDLIQLSDTHITAERGNTSYKALAYSVDLLTDAIDQINNMKGLDFVLFTGDLVDSATANNYREYFSTLTKLKYPTLNAFGNHDFNYGNLGKNDVLNIVRKCNPNYNFSNSYYAFSPKTDYRIIILDGVIQSNSTSNGSLSDEQLNFLDNELNKNKDKIVVIAMHFPLVEPFVSQEHKLLNADKVNEILVKYKNPIVVLTGHYHAAKIKRIGNIVYVSSPSLVTYPMAFRHIKITNYKDRVHYKFDFINTRLENVKEANRQSVISYATLAGFEKDRDTEFTYFKSRPKSAHYKKNKISRASKTHKTSKRELEKLNTPSNKQKKKTSFFDKIKTKFQKKEADSPEGF